MKLIAASGVLLAGGASAKNLRSSPRPTKAASYARSIAGLQALRKLSRAKDGRALQLVGFDELGLQLSQFGASNACGETCDDEALCASFMTGNDLEATCNEGCVPQAALDFCEMCSGSGANNNPALDASALDSRPMLGGAGASQGASAGVGASSAATAEQRQGFLDAALGMACGSCEYYKCCTNGETKYDACSDRLPDPDAFFPGEGLDFLEDWEGVMGDMTDWESLLPEDWGAWDAPGASLGACRMNEQCAALGLVGQCCPTKEGDMLECCNDDEAASSPGRPLVPEDWGAWDAPGTAPGATQGGSGSGPGGTDQASGLSMLGQLVDSFDCPDTCDCEALFSGTASLETIEDACNSNCLPTVTVCEEVCSGDAADSQLCNVCNFLSCCGEDEVLGESKFDTCQEYVPNLEQLLDVGTGANWGGPGSAVNLPALDLESLFNGVKCADTCEEPDLCGSFLTSMGDQTVIEEACDASCLPEVTTCEHICGNMDGPEVFGPMIDNACQTCQFFECCATNSFETCGSKMPAMPAMGNLFPDIDWEAWGTPGASQGDNLGLEGVDWSEIEEALADVFDQLQTAIQDVVGDTSVPEFCPDGNTCPVEGFCDIFDGNTANWNLGTIDYEQACTENALFLCGPAEFKQMCTEKCTAGSLAAPGAVTAEARMDGDFADAMFCSLCDIATCCETKGDSTTFEDCATAAVPQEFGDAIESAAGDESSSEPIDQTGDESASTSTEDASSANEANGQSAESDGSLSDSEPLVSETQPGDDPNDPILAAIEREESAASGSSNFGTTSHCSSDFKAVATAKDTTKDGAVVNVTCNHQSNFSTDKGIPNSHLHCLSCPRTASEPPQ
ncbi:hypothetical protein ACHAXT_010545 [Thalassiosira profunda]